jgi:hypothetical protein
MMEILGEDWKPSWLPLFAFEGEYFLVECQDRPVKGSPVLHFFLEDPAIKYAFVSLTRMAQTMEAAFQQGFINSTDEGFGLEIDTKVVAQCHRKLNPGASFPYAIY